MDVSRESSPTGRRDRSRVEAEKRYVEAGGLVLDLAHRTLLRGRYEAIHLSKLQCRLLEVLMAHPGRLSSHDLLSRRIWDTGYTEGLRTNLSELVCRLRETLEELEGPGIESEHGKGYRLDVEEDP